MSRVYRLRDDVVHRSWEGEHYLLTADGRFHSVTDPSGAFVMDLLARRGRTLRALSQEVMRRFEAPSRAEVEHDLVDFLGTLCRRGVLEVVDAPSEKPASRIGSPSERRQR